MELDSLYMAAIHCMSLWSRVAVEKFLAAIGSRIVQLTTDQPTRQVFNGSMLYTITLQ